MSWKRQQEFVGRYIKFARHAAWGDNLNIPGLEGSATPPTAEDNSDPSAGQAMNRRMRRMQEKDSKKDKSEKKTKGIKAARASPAATPPSGSTGPRKRVVAENGKILVVDSVGNVYLEQANEDGETQEFLLDVSLFPSSFRLSLLIHHSPTSSPSQPLEILLSSGSQSGFSTRPPPVSSPSQPPTLSLILKMTKVHHLARLAQMTSKSSRKARQPHQTATVKLYGGRRAPRVDRLVF